MTDAPHPADAVLAELMRLGEIAAALLDGEEVQHIITDRAMHYIANPDGDYRFLAGDYYDVDAARFLAAKKLLLRIGRLGRTEVSTSVWVPVPGTDAVTVAIHNGVHHRYYAFGQLSVPVPPEMAQVFETGRCQQLTPDGANAVATVLAPVRDSLHDVVAVVELSAPVLPDDRPAWS